MQLNGRHDHVRRQCRKVNSLITEYRVNLQHAICDLKNALMATSKEKTDKILNCVQHLFAGIEFYSIDKFNFDFLLRVIQLWYLLDS